MHFFRCAIASTFFLLMSGVAGAAASDWDMLRKAAQAGQRLSLSGVYLHQIGRREQETFRIYRVEQGGQVLERRESLDGPPREIIRKGSELTSYAPDKSSLLAARASASRLFPAVLPENIGMLSASYALDVQGKDRYAGIDCRWYRLRGLDKLHYNQSFCIDPVSGLPLKMIVATPGGNIVEQYTFSSVDLKPPRNKAVFKPRYSLGYTQHSEVQPAAALPTTASPPRIAVKGLPNGFRLLKAIERMLPGQQQPAHHLIYGDGLVMLSLFIEPKNKSHQPRAASVQGTLSMASVPYGNYWLTMVGDMPGSSLNELLKGIKVTVN